MRKSLIILCGGMLLACILAGCNKVPQKNDATQGTSVTTTVKAPALAYDPQPGDGVLFCKRSGNQIEVTVMLPDHVGEEVSLIALTDPMYQLTWWENADACLSDLGQIKLNDKGQGTLTITLKSEINTAYVVLTAKDCAYITEVN